MFDQTRTEMLLGTQGINTLAGSHVAVFGVGGVGGYVCEALARAGVGKLSLFDDDIVAPSNVNRQIVALQSTIGQPKVQVMQARIADINPACVVQANRLFYTPQTAGDWPLQTYDYIVDAIDTVTAKLELITRAKQAGVPVISSMGAGNKLHPELFEIADISKTSICPLARIMRKELAKRGIKGVKVVYTKEMPCKPIQPETVALTAAPACAPAVEEPQRPGKPKTVVPGSISFVPATVGLLLAGQVTRDLLGLA